MKSLVVLTSLKKCKRENKNYLYLKILDTSCIHDKKVLVSKRQQTKAKYS